jgi:hypothetical protein
MYNMCIKSGLVVRLGPWVTSGLGVSEYGVNESFMHYHYTSWR